MMLGKNGILHIILGKDHFILSATFLRIRQPHIVQRTYHTLFVPLQDLVLHLLIEQLFVRIHHN